MKLSNVSETERVRRYLMQKVVHSGAEPERLPTEMALVRTIGVSRVTVRRAISDLLSGHVIRKIPGKQGVYTNPGMADIAVHSIAVLRNSNYVGSSTAVILGAMCEELSLRGCFCSLNFFQIGDDDPDVVAEELKHCGFDGVLIFSARNAAVKGLLDRGVPVIAVEFPGAPVEDGRNRFRFDGEAFGRQVVEAILARKLRRVLLEGNYEAVFRGMEAAAAGRLILDRSQRPEGKTRLRQKLAEGCYDGVAVMTHEIGMRIFYDVLHTLPGIPKPEIFLFPSPESALFKKNDPGFYTENFDPAGFLGQLRELGKAVAGGVFRMIAGLPVESCKVKIQP